MNDFMKFIESNNGSCSLYTNVYNFTKTKGDSFYPDYDSAVIDRIYVDVDVRIKEDGVWKNIPAYEHMLRVHEWAKKNDYIHFPRCTGTGYDIVIVTDPNSFIKNKKQCVGNAQRWLCKELEIETDPQVIGDIARIHRIDNTFNPKESARRYCIPLDPEIIYLGEPRIFDIAKEQRFSSNWYGTKYWNIEEFDSAEVKFNNIPTNTTMQIDESQFTDLSDKTPPCIKNLLSRKELNWKERRNVILYLRDNAYFQDETIAILKKHLTPKKFLHCLKSERQPYHLYRNEKYMFPRQREIIDLNACPHPQGEFCALAEKGCLLYGRDKESVVWKNAKRTSSTSK